MKKIVGIIAAVAMAASVFAVDFTAGFQLKADLFNYNGVSESAAALKLWHENSKDDKPFIFSVSGDRAGGTLKFYDAGNSGAQAMTANYWNIWFKPLDMLKIDLGAQDIKLNCETVTYWRGKLFGAGDWGYKATVDVDALSVALAILPEQNSAWFKDGKTVKAEAADAAYKKAYDAAIEAGKTIPQAKVDGDSAKAGVLAGDTPDATIGEMALYAQYGADFGTIKFLFDAKPAGGKNFKNIFVGAGYSNTFGDISMFADVGFSKADTINGLSVDADAKYRKDAFGAEGYVRWVAGNLETIKKETMALTVIAKASYALDAGTVYFKLINLDLFTEKMPFEQIAVGFDGNMGALSYELEADIKTVAAGDSTKINFSMPCWFRISF